MSSPKLEIDSVSPDSLKELVINAKKLYQKHFPAPATTCCTVAPGRVNLIGEHVDYTGGFVFPLAIEYSTVVYGSGFIDDQSTSSSLQFVSTLSPETGETKSLNKDTEPPTTQEAHSSWTWYVIGVVMQYIPDLPSNTCFNLKFAISGNVPLGGGLSSSASLEVATARFLETILGTAAFSSSDMKEPAKIRALRCQKAENVWCHSPCGIMDQYVSSAASQGSFLLIDCRSYDYQKIQMKQPNSVVLVVTNSHVSHDIAGGEYPIRVAQCKTATLALQIISDKVESLRDATLELLEQADMDDISFRRARHAVTENARVTEAKAAIEAGDWTELGRLLNASHASMRDDYEVSCAEVDILVELAQQYEGVYGSRLTGGGFGGCTVTLVEQDRVQGLMEHLKTGYIAKTGKECDCFVTSPGPGARLLGMDTT
jgi:galactokinase